MSASKVVRSSVAARRANALMEAIETRKYCDGDNSFATAASIGNPVTYISANASLTANSDTKDFYKFSVPLAAQSVSMKLTGLSSNANLYVYKADHTEIANSKNTGTQNETLNLNLTPGGTYYIEVRCTSGNTNYKLQLASDKSGNSRPEASDWGTLNNGVTTGWGEYVGTLDGSDYIKFTTQINGVTKIGLSSLTGNADLKLLKPDGTTIALANNGSTVSEQISVNLTAGTYYAKVLPADSSVDATYFISITAPSPVDPGETRATAEDLGTLGNSAITRTGTVATTDPADYFKFKLTSDSAITATLSNMSGDCDLSLWDANGNFLSSSTRNGTSNDEIFNGLKAGTYFLRVVPGYTNLASYKLTLSRTSPASILDQGFNNRTGASTIHVSSGTDKATLTDAIINRFDAHDYYKVETTGPGNLIAVVQYTTDDLDVDILNANGTVIASGNQANKSGDSALVEVPGAGTYYIHVKQHVAGNEGSASRYTLNLQVPQDYAGNTKATAKQITSPFSTTATVGDDDKWDYYKINVPSSSYISMDLSVSGKSAILHYFNSDGTIIGAEGANPGDDAELSYFLHTGGVRYVAVSREVPGFSTYTLNVKTQAF